MPVSQPQWRSVIQADAPHSPQLTLQGILEYYGTMPYPDDAPADPQERHPYSQSTGDDLPEPNEPDIHPDGVVAAILLQQHIAAAPGDFG